MKTLENNLLSHALTATLTSLFTLFVTVLLVGCGQRIEKHTVVDATPQPTAPGSGDPAKGTETHGGDVLRARALSFKDMLTLTQEELDKKEPLNKDTAFIPKQEFRSMLRQVWLGVSRYVLHIPDSPLRNHLVSLVKGDQRFTILDDIRTSSFDVKVFVPPGEKNADKPEYAPCLDYHGETSTAGAKLNDRSGAICVDARKLAKEGPELNELAGLISHEHAHHMGLDEKDAVVIQQFVSENWQRLSLIGANFEKLTGEVKSQEALFIDSRALGESTELEVRVTSEDGRFRGFYVDVQGWFTKQHTTINTETVVATVTRPPSGWQDIRLEGFQSSPVASSLTLEVISDKKVLIRRPVVVPPKKPAQFLFSIFIL